MPSHEQNATLSEPTSCNVLAKTDRKDTHHEIDEPKQKLSQASEVSYLAEEILTLVFCKHEAFSLVLFLVLSLRSFLEHTPLRVLRCPCYKSISKQD